METITFLKCLYYFNVPPSPGPEFYFTRECEKFGALMPSLPQIFVLSLATPSFLIPLFVSPGTKNKMQTGYQHKTLLNK